jgi:hypothetical protein
MCAHVSFAILAYLFCGQVGFKGWPDDEPVGPVTQIVMENVNSDVIVLEKSDAKSNESPDIFSVSDLDPSHLTRRAKKKPPLLFMSIPPLFCFPQVLAGVIHQIGSHPRKKIRLLSRAIH